MEESVIDLSCLFIFEAEICFPEYPFASQDRTKCCMYPETLGDYYFNCSDYMTSEINPDSVYFISIPTGTLFFFNHSTIMKFY